MPTLYPCKPQQRGLRILHRFPKGSPFPVIANATTPVQIPEETEGHVISLHMLQATTAYRMCLEYLDFPNT